MWVVYSGAGKGAEAGQPVIVDYFGGAELSKLYSSTIILEYLRQYKFHDVEDFWWADTEVYIISNSAKESIECNFFCICFIFVLTKFCCCLLFGIDIIKNKNAHL